MLSLPDAAAIEAALYQPLSEPLRSILATHLEQITSQGLRELTHVVVIEAGDTEADIIGACGWSPLIHPIDGTRFDDSDFQPYWAWLSDLGGWYELLHPVGNDGFAYVLFIAAEATLFSKMCEEGLSCAF